MLGCKFGDHHIVYAPVVWRLRENELLHSSARACQPEHWSPVSSPLQDQVVVDRLPLRVPSQRLVLYDDLDSEGCRRHWETDRAHATPLSPCPNARSRLTSEELTF